MAGDSDNVRVWGGADAYTAPLGTTAPTDVTTAWAAAWDALGLLGEGGLGESSTEDQTDHYAWGNILVRTVRSRHTRTITVTALEDNDVVFHLLNPGSTSSTSAGPTPPAGVTTRVVKTPEADRRAFGFELRDGDLTKRRIIPSGEIVSVGDRTENETEMATRELTIRIYPASDGTLYTEITNDPGAVVPA